jgi:hypothetical protein
MDDYDAMFDAAGQAYNADPQLLKTIWYIESGGKSVAPNGSSGEIGPMQFMPGTAKKYNIDPTDMSQAIPAAAKIIRHGLDMYNGDPAAALRVYNGGDTGPNNPKTIPYVMKAQALYPSMTVGQKIAAAQPAEDPSIAMGRSIVEGKIPETPAQAEDPSVALGRSIVEQTMGNTPTGNTPIGNTPTGNTPTAEAPRVASTLPAAMPAGASPTLDFISPDLRANPIANGIRNALQPGPNDFQMQGLGRFLPIAHDETTGANRLAVPQIVQQFGNGALDLIEGPRTGVVTPDAQQVLGTAVLAGKLTPQRVAIPTSESVSLRGSPDLSASFKQNPLAADYNGASLPPGASSAIPAAAPAQAWKINPLVAAVVQKVSDGVISAISKGIGYHFGDFGGYLVGEAAGAVLNDIKNRYGASAAQSALKWMKATTDGPAMTPVVGNQTMNALQGR